MGMGVMMMKPLNKITLLMLMLALTSFSGGCWNYRDMNQLGIISGVGIDLAPEPGKVLLTIQVIKTSEVKGGGGGESSGGGGGSQPPRPVVIIESVGSTVFEAVRNAVVKFSRRLYWAHNQIVIIGKEAATEGVRHYVDLFIRDAEPRPTAWMLVTPEKAGDLIKAQGKIEKIPAMEIAELIQAQSATSKAGGFTVHDFANRLLSKTGAPLATEIRLDKDNKFQLAGTAIFKGDKLVDFIGKKETRGLLWVTNKAQSGIIVVNDSGSKDKVGLELIRSSSKIKAEIRGKEIIIKVKVNVQSNLGDQTSESALIKPETLKSLARREATVIRNEINAALKKAKELNTDIFGFGEAVHRADPKAWKELEPRWDEIFPELKVELIVKANIGRVGLIIKPLKPE